MFFLFFIYLLCFIISLVQRSKSEFIRNPFDFRDSDLTL